MAHLLWPERQPRHGKNRRFGPPCSRHWNCEWNRHKKTEGKRPSPYHLKRRCIMAVELREEASGKVLVVKLSGKLTREDYEHFLPEVERLIGNTARSACWSRCTTSTAGPWGRCGKTSSSTGSTSPTSNAWPWSATASGKRAWPRSANPSRRPRCATSMRPKRPRLSAGSTRGSCSRLGAAQALRGGQKLLLFLPLPASGRGSFYPSIPGPGRSTPAGPSGDPQGS